MQKIKSVQEGDKPWEVLYDIVVHNPQYLRFHVGQLVSIQSSQTIRLKNFMQYMITKKKSGILLQRRGGELLTRCNDVYLPQKFIGSAFGGMPVNCMKKMFPKLLEQQLIFIAGLDVQEDTYYSVNLEGMDHDLVVWNEVRDILITFGSLPVNIEIKENTALSPQVMQIIADVCTKTTIKIYIDDLCSCCHALPDNEEYMVMMIEILHPFIKSVKVDYEVMQDIFRLENYHGVANNLYDFRWLWESYCDAPTPFVIFESMPRQEPRWIRRLVELTEGYAGYQFQTG